MRYDRARSSLDPARDLRRHAYLAGTMRDPAQRSVSSFTVEDVGGYLGSRRRRRSLSDAPMFHNLDHARSCAQ